MNINSLIDISLTILSERNLSILYHIVSVSKIEEDKNIPTAEIGRIGKQLVIKYNPEFIEQHANTPIKFIGVLVHEILHDILGHLDFNKYKGNKKQWNIAMDAVIQSILHSLNIKPSNKKDYYSNEKKTDPGFYITKFFEDYYSLEGIEALLRPPNIVKRVANSEIVKDPEINSIRKSLYNLDGKEKSSYKENKPTYETKINEFDIYNFLSKYTEEELEKITLISNISDKEESLETPEEGENKAKEYQKGTGGLIKQKEIENLFQEMGKSAGPGGPIDNIIIKVKRENNLHLRKAIQKALMESTKSKIVSKFRNQAKPSVSPVFPDNIQSYDLIKLSMGHYPLLFRKQVIKPSFQDLNIYIDVSGSVYNYLEWIYGCILDLKYLVNTNCFAFSTQVVELKEDDIKNGKIDTTYGTDFNVVVEHILKTNTKKSVIFTDGQACISDNNIKKAKSTTIVGAVIPQKNAFFSYELKKNVYKNSWETKELLKFCSEVHRIPYVIEGSYKD